MADRQPDDPSAFDAPRGPGQEREAPQEHEPDPERAKRRLGDSLISSLLGDSSAALRRGQGLVSGVAQGTKEELVRMISAEVRGFLDKMDAADLVQEIVSGLVIEMKTEIRFRRDESGRLEPDIRTSEAKLGHQDEAEAKATAKPEPKPKPKPEAKAKGTMERTVERLGERLKGERKDRPRPEDGVDDKG